MEALLSYFGYQLKQGGTGSGVKFVKDGSNEAINFHKLYPSGILKRYVLDQVNVRIGPELHRNIAVYAIEHGKSLNAAVEEAIGNMVGA